MKQESRAKSFAPSLHICPSGVTAFWSACGWHCLQYLPLGRNGLEMAYLCVTAFVVGRRSRFDRRLSEQAPSPWWSTFRRLLEGESAAVPSSSLGLRRRLVLCEAGRTGRDCARPWTELAKAGSAWWASLTALLESAGNGWSSSAALGEPDDGCPSSSAALAEPSCDALGSSVEFLVWRR